MRFMPGSCKFFAASFRGPSESGEAGIHTPGQWVPGSPNPISGLLGISITGTHIGKQPMCAAPRNDFRRPEASLAGSAYCIPNDSAACSTNLLVYVFVRSIFAFATSGDDWLNTLSTASAPLGSMRPVVEYMGIVFFNAAR